MQIALLFTGNEEVRSIRDRGFPLQIKYVSCCILVIESSGGEKQDGLMVGKKASSHPGCCWKQSLRQNLHRVYLFGRWSQGAGMGDRISETKEGKQLKMSTGNAWSCEDPFEVYLNSAHGQKEKTLVHVSNWSKLQTQHFLVAEVWMLNGSSHVAAWERPKGGRQGTVSFLLRGNGSHMSVAGIRDGLERTWHGTRRYPTQHPEEFVIIGW